MLGCTDGLDDVGSMPKRPYPKSLWLYSFGNTHGYRSAWLRAAACGLYVFQFFRRAQRQPGRARAGDAATAGIVSPSAPKEGRGGSVPETAGRDVSIGCSCDGAIA